MKARKKVSKKSVNFREATGTRNCGNCDMLHGHSCDLVLGIISKPKEEICDRWVKKDGR